MYIAVFTGDASQETKRRIAEAILTPVIAEASVRGYAVDGLTPDELIDYVTSILPHAAITIDGEEAN